MLRLLWAAAVICFILYGCGVIARAWEAQERKERLNTEKLTIVSDPKGHGIRIYGTPEPETAYLMLVELAHKLAKTTRPAAIRGAVETGLQFAEDDQERERRAAQ